MPSIARFPKGIYDLPNTFNLIWGGEIGRIGEFTSYSLFPGGRMSKDIFKMYANDSPEMAVDWLMGIPLHNMGQLMRKESNKKKKINKFLGEQ
jgi:hypothetical protein